jgi:hypothetical protein
MLFNHVGQQHFIHDEVFDVEEQTVLVLIQIVEANTTFGPKLNSSKSDGVDGAIVVTASRWLGLLVFLIVVLLGCLPPQERDRPRYHGFVVPEVILKLFFSNS